MATLLPIGLASSSRVVLWSSPEPTSTTRAEAPRLNRDRPRSRNTEEEKLRVTRSAEKHGSSGQFDAEIDAASEPPMIDRLNGRDFDPQALTTLKVRRAKGSSATRVCRRDHAGANGAIETSASPPALDRATSRVRNSFGIFSRLVSELRKNPHRMEPGSIPDIVSMWNRATLTCFSMASESQVCLFRVGLSATRVGRGPAALRAQRNYRSETRQHVVSSCYGTMTAAPSTPLFLMASNAVFTSSRGKSRRCGA